MKRSGALLAAVAFGIAAATTACSSAGDDSRTYTAEEIESFQPENSGFYYGEPVAMTAANAFQTGWPDSTLTVFEPAACLTYLTSSEMLAVSDGSDTGEDGLVFIEGIVTDGSVGTGDVEAVYIKTRVFSSEASARSFVDNLRVSVTPCASGYTFTSDALVWTVGTITASDTPLEGVGEILVIDERDVRASSGEGAVVDQGFAHYTHYVYAQGNVAFIASYVHTTESSSNNAAAELIGQFIDHLG